MVPRYARPAMTAIWEPEAKYRIWFEIEAHATEKLGELGVVPKSAAKALWDWWATDPKIDVEAIDAIEAVTKHDVIAFLTWVAENVGEEARFMHQGMTSSDVLDTTLAVQLARSTDLLLEDLDQLLAAIKRRAEEHKYTPTIGRSHGIHAEPVTFGLKLAQAYAEFDRCKTRLLAAREEIATCAISGAVGTFANIDPSVEEYVAEKLGLKPEPVSTQVIPRDRHAMYFATLAVIAGSIEEAMTPSVAKNMAWRSRGMTCVETGSGDRPSFSATYSSMRGSILANVPTAPEMAQVAISSRAAIRRLRARWNSAWKVASLMPNVVGSAWMPWLRPMVSVSLCS